MSSCFLRWFCFFNIPFTFSFAKVFSFIFSISFFYLEFSEMLNFQNIWCLIKTQLKNITQTIFQGGSPWATLIHNSMVCLRVHYCVQLLPEVIVFFLLLESKLKPIASKLKSIESNLKWIWSWYTIVWFVWGYTIVSSCFLRWFCFFLHSLYIFLC